ncbi:MAG TPA: putative Ig domain-containing protein [Candidatus Acidoferrales bacterium]|nr:putative Ig domain-containing protein [Candidatus Acidoferrales bacterium]
MKNATHTLRALCVSFFLAWVLAGCGSGGTSGTSGGGGGAGGGGTSPEVITITTKPTVMCARTLPFTLTLQETGAKTAVTWSVISGGLPDGLTLDGSTGIISGTPSSTAAVTNATVKVSDTNASATLTLNFEVFERLVINAVTPPPAHVNAPYSLSVTAQGSSAVNTWSIVAGQLPPGLSMTQGTQNLDVAIISGTPGQTGTYDFTIQATDFTLPQTATLDVSIAVDSHLAITKSQLKNAEQNAVYTDSFTAVNGTTPLTWAINGTLPAGLTLNASTGQVSGTPTAQGGYPYTVTVTDSSATPASDSGQGDLTVAQALQIVGNLNSAYIGKPYIDSLTAIGGYYPYTWSVSSGSLPPGLAINSYGTIEGTPTQLGAYSFVLQVSDSATPPYSATQAATLNVTPTPLSVLGNPFSPAPLNVLYHSQIPISGGTPPYTLSITSGTLPPGLTFDPTTGYIDGTPTQVGTFNFSVMGTDSSNPMETGTANAFIQIRNPLGRNDSIATATPLGNSADVSIPVVLSISPYIDPIDATTANPDTDYYRLVADAGGTVHVETFAQRSWGADTLDSVIELLDQNGNRMQSCGQPNYTASCLNDDIDSTTLDSALDLKVPGTSGTQTTFYAHVFDWRGDARPDMQYYLNVSGVIEPLTITSTNLGPGATRGISYQKQMTSTGGIGAVTWSLDSGALPAGWALSSSGVLSGTATTDGFYTFTIKATDSGNPPEVARAQFTLQIAEPVVITSSPTFPTACANQPYSFTVQTTGGIPPIQFGFSSLNWIAINLNQQTGTFSGTTGAVGTFTGSLGAIDSAQPPSSAGQTISLTVVNCP